MPQGRGGKKPARDEYGYISAFRAEQERVARDAAEMKEALGSSYMGARGERKAELDKAARANQFLEDFKDKKAGVVRRKK